MKNIEEKEQLKIKKQANILDVCMVTLVILTFLRPNDGIMAMFMNFVVYLSTLFDVKFANRKGILTKVILWWTGIMSALFLITIVFAIYVVVTGQADKYVK